MGFFLKPSYVLAQDLDSNSYTIKDPNFVGSSGISDSGSDNLSLVSVVGNSIADARLESGSYALGSGFPNGIQTNVPLIKCFESSTDDSVGGATDTTCEAYPLTSSTGGNDSIAGDGLQGICGTPGCYDRAKIEIDSQSNPIDTLYLTSILNVDTGVEYFLQSDNTIDTTYDINDYQTICEIEGYDPRTGSGCEVDTDLEWNETLQEYNVLNLTPGVTYTAKVRALQGDFTEGQYSPTETITIEYPSLSFDIDIADSSGVTADTDAPHVIQLGNITATTVTATDLIWLDLGTNNFNGFTVSVESNGLSNGAQTIPSTSEDLDVDAGGDGGFGLKLDTIIEDSLGPLNGEATYITTGVNEVGALGVATAILNTNATGSNQGPISGGRASIEVKAKASSSTAPGAYSDQLTFTMVANP